MTQQEFYIGKPGADADMAKMNAKKPDVIAFNGYANQYKDHPISVRKGERVRMYVLNAGPSIWSAFHVIGTVFDRTVDRGPGRARRPDHQPRPVAGRLGRVHARRGGDLPLRDPRLRRHGQGRPRRAGHAGRAQGRRPQPLADPVRPRPSPRPAAQVAAGPPPPPALRAPAATAGARRFAPRPPPPRRPRAPGPATARAPGRRPRRPGRGAATSRRGRGSAAWPARSPRSPPSPRAAPCATSSCAPSGRAAAWSSSASAVARARERAPGAARSAATSRSSTRSTSLSTASRNSASFERPRA